ncbi:Gfo/Idh/MocA family oxidoreductase [Pelagibius litoralis]|uniref:Gfo/Idh/MocA family oxidoreductase n=1 Tax=Pelagibius litoralis TaxID=374515 RepID=A0A967C3A3_9PROT|nr:Gfo/Idh/MocA family oxidoreductase [Pelagibius litoralis]NIA67425.1 Gfo/Idh/MocA family oxidoreductase [Pelagibius litoralis]
MDSVGVGLIGTGYMGKCHAIAYSAVATVFGLSTRPRLELLCDLGAEQAAAAAAAFGFARSTDDWHKLVSDPAVDVVSITTPNGLHPAMAIEAARNGKHVYCEKPLALTLEKAEAMAAAVREAGVKSLVGYNYTKNPAVSHAKRLVEQGAIGRLLHFRGCFDEDYLADPALPHSWRMQKEKAGAGALADMASHLIHMAQHLCGPIGAVMADLTTMHAERPINDGSHAATGRVENDDTVSALVRFRAGFSGSLDSSRIAWGRKSRFAWELHGSAGMIAFDQERMNELQLYQAKGPKAEQGFKTILSGPAHPPYGNFVPAPGHSLGYNDIKTVEVAHLMRGLAGEETLYPNFTDALDTERVMHAMLRSAKEGQWVSLD